MRQLLNAVDIGLGELLADDSISDQQKEPINAQLTWQLVNHQSGFGLHLISGPTASQHRKYGGSPRWRRSVGAAIDRC